MKRKSGEDDNDWRGDTIFPSPPVSEEEEREMWEAMRGAIKSKDITIPKRLPIMTWGGEEKATTVRVNVGYATTKFVSRTMHESVGAAIDAGERIGELLGEMVAVYDEKGRLVWTQEN